MSVLIGSARSSYGNTTPGDQSGGKEVSTQAYYVHSSGKWRVFRARDPKKREMIAVAMERACKNNDIGYSQGSRLTLTENVKPYGYDPAKTTKPVNTDCSALVRCCCLYAGIKVDNFITSNEPSKLLGTGEFIELTGDKYAKKSDYLCRGDLLVSPVKGHTVAVLSNGPKYKADVIETSFVYNLGERELDNGCEGKDVKELQSMLIQLGYSCGEYGADSEFGDATEAAVRKFQSDHQLIVDGIVGPDTLKALLNADMKEADTTGTHVIIRGGNCYIRTEPNTNASKVGTAHAGTTYVYGGQTSVDGWIKILASNVVGWVSGKYAFLE